MFKSLPIPSPPDTPAIGGGGVIVPKIDDPPVVPPVVQKEQVLQDGELHTAVPAPEHNIPVQAA